MGTVDVESLQHPVVQFSSDLELKGAERVGDALETVTNGVGVVVEWIDAPAVAHVRMRVELYAVNDWVSESRVGVFVVDLRTQRIGSFFVKTKPHLFKQPQIFLHRSITILRRQSFSPLPPHLLSGLRANKGISLLDELNGILMQYLEVIRSMGDLPWLVAHKFDVLLDVDNIFDVFFGGVGVVEAQVAVSFAHLRLHEVETHCLAVTNMQVAVWLGRETSQNNVSEL